MRVFDNTEFNAAAHVGASLRTAPGLLDNPNASILSCRRWDGLLWVSATCRLGVRQCQRLFPQLGFRSRKARLMVAQANPER